MTIIDADAIHEFYKGDEELLTDIANLFIENLPRVTVRLRAAIANQDALELREVSHQFKSGLGYFFAPELNGIAAELENRGKHRRLEGCEELSEDLFRGLNRLVAELSVRTKTIYEISF